MSTILFFRLYEESLGNDAVIHYGGSTAGYLMKLGFTVKNYSVATRVKSPTRIVKHQKRDDYKPRCAPVSFFLLSLWSLFNNHLDFRLVNHLSSKHIVHHKNVSMLKFLTLLPLRKLQFPLVVLHFLVEQWLLVLQKILSIFNILSLLQHLNFLSNIQHVNKYFFIFSNCLKFKHHFWLSIHLLYTYTFLYCVFISLFYIFSFYTLQ